MEPHVDKSKGTESVVTRTLWTLDPSHSEIGFRVKHLMLTNVKGVFKEYGAEISTNGNDFSTAEINFWLNPNSIDTRDEKRDTHLRSSDFFDYEHFNKITFKSTSIEKTKGDLFKMNGVLTIKGIGKPVSFEVEYGGIIKDPWGAEKAGFNISGKVNRKDWGLNWNVVLESGGFLVGDDVSINCEVELVKQV
jgi:polyisoprenoid-binding protein YceI